MQEGGADDQDSSRFIVHAAKERHRKSVEQVLEVLRRFDRQGRARHLRERRRSSFGLKAMALSGARWRSCDTGAPPRDPRHHWCQLHNALRLSSRHQKIAALNEQLRSRKDENARLRSELERSLGEQLLAVARTGAARTISFVSDMSPT